MTNYPDFRDTYENAIVLGVHPKLFAAIDDSAIGGTALAENIKAIIIHREDAIRRCEEARSPV